MHTLALICTLLAQAPSLEAGVNATPHAGQKSSVGELKVLVLPVSHQDVPTGVADTLTDMLASELANRPTLSIVTLDAVDALLEGQLRKDMLGCDEVACAAEIGAALDVDRIAVGSLRRMGTRFVFTVVWLDAVYAAPLGQATRTVSEEAYLPRALVQVVASILDGATVPDTHTIELKRRPTFWTFEVLGGWAAPLELEAYDRGYAGALRLAWGGRAPSSKALVYLVGGIGATHVSGRTRGTNGDLSYQRTFFTPHLEVRGALPVAFRDRLRLQGSVGAGLGAQLHRLQRPNERPSKGAISLFELRGSAGLWHKVTRSISVFGNYRGRLFFPGRGADPISESVQQGSSQRQIISHGVEGGLAVHF